MSPDHRHTPEEERRIREAALDATIEGTFPASDPPSSLPNPDDDDVLTRNGRGAGVTRDHPSSLIRIAGISGSLRRASFNTSLLRAAADMAPRGSTIDIASIAGIPLYDGDREATEGIPPAVTTLKDAIAAAHGLLIVTPEYNNSMPGVVKNAIDWLSRPPSDIRRVFGGRPVTVMGATPGQGGTSLSQAAWLPVLRTLGTMPWFGGRLMVSNATKVFDDRGRIVDDAIRSRLEAFVKGFIEFAARVAGSHQAGQRLS